MPKRIINADLEVSGKANISEVANGAGNFVTRDGVTNEIKERTPAETLSDLGAATIDDKNYVHNQGSASNIWNITHSLNKYVSVTVVDSAGTVVIGQIDYVDLNNITITFNASFSGDAYIN